MFVTTRDPGVRRRNKIYNGNTTARSSKTSLLSVFTVGSAGSGGSNTTITQDSFNRSQHKRRKRPKEHRTRTSRAHDGDKNKSVDVFDFLVENSHSKDCLPLLDQANEDTVSLTGEDNPEDLNDGHVQHSIEESENGDNSSDSDDEDAVPDIVIHTDGSDPEVYYRSMSDSGISMGSSSIDASLSSLPPRLPVLPEEPPSRPSSQPRTGHELALFDPRWTWSTSPGPFHDGQIPPPAPVPPQIMYDMPVYPPYPPYTPYGTPPPMPEEEIRGSAIRIREPSHQDIKPKCFRSFTKVSTRLILQLQDDIAELEGELSVLDAELDAIDADSGSDDGLPPQPGTAKHMLKARECEIYQELHYKLDQYTTSLGSMQKIDDMSQPAVLSDLTKHHQWLESRISPSFRARHLVGNDLRKFPTTQPKGTTAPAYQDTRFMAYTILINTLLPLIAFKLITSLLSRLILLIIVVLAGAAVQERTKTTIKAEDMNCILACVSISVFAALFL